MINYNYLDLQKLNMNHFTVLDAELYCQISNINIYDIKILYLDYNNLTDINGVSVFKNLEHLKLKDLNPLNNLISLDIDNLNLTDESEIVDILKSFSNLIVLNCKNTFKTVDIKKELKGIEIYD